MFSPALLGAMIQTTILIILCIGFTVTFQIERFPNFAHLSLATVGTIITYAMVQILGVNPYLAWPVSTIICSIIALGVYSILIRPMKKTGAKDISLALASVALSILISAFIAIFSYWAVIIHGSPPVYFMLTAYDFNWNSLPGVAITAPLTCVSLIILLQLFFHKTKTGTAIRAVSEDEQLASILGININRMHLLSWTIVGGLVGLAGAIIPLWRSTSVGFSDEFLIAVMAGSLVGGIDRIYGAVIGGILVSVSMEGLPQIIPDYIHHAEPNLYEFSLPVQGFAQLIPIAMIFLVLMIEPEGITGFFGKLHTFRRCFGWINRPRGGSNGKNRESTNR